MTPYGFVGFLWYSTIVETKTKGAIFALPHQMCECRFLQLQEERNLSHCEYRFLSFTWKHA